MDDTDLTQEVVAAQMAALLAQHPDKLDDAQREKLRQEVVGGWQRAQKIRAVPLANGDAPFLSYTPQSKRGDA